MTGQATTHRVLDYGLCGNSLSHISVASCAIDLGFDVRRVTKFYKRFRVKSVNALPRNFTLALGILQHLFHAGLVSPELGVTKHALLNRGNARGGALVGARVAVQTLHRHSDVLFMRKRDRLLSKYYRGA